MSLKSPFLCDLQEEMRLRGYSIRKEKPRLIEVLYPINLKMRVSEHLQVDWV